MLPELHNLNILDSLYSKQFLKACTIPGTDAIINNAAKGWYTTPNGKTWYFDPTDPLHTAIFGEVEIDGKFYY